MRSRLSPWLALSVAVVALALALVARTSIAAQPSELNELLQLLRAQSAVTGLPTKSVFPTSPKFCTSPTHSVVSLTAGTSSAVPASDLTLRRFVTICNSPENTGTPKAKCQDGAPVSVTMGIANAGDPLAVGTCITYAVTTGVKCTTDTTGAVVTTYECQ